MLLSGVLSPGIQSAEGNDAVTVGEWMAGEAVSEICAAECTKSGDGPNVLSRFARTGQLLQCTLTEPVDMSDGLIDAGHEPFDLAAGTRQAAQALRERGLGHGELGAPLEQLLERELLLGGRHVCMQISMLAGNVAGNDFGADAIGLAAAAHAFGRSGAHPGYWPRTPAAQPYGLGWRATHGKWRSIPFPGGCRAAACAARRGLHCGCCRCDTAQSCVRHRPPRCSGCPRLRPNQG